MKRNIYIAGGDKRAVYLSREFMKTDRLYTVGLPVSSYDTFAKADIAVFPIPLCNKDGYLNAPMADRKMQISEVMDPIGEDTKVFGGMFTDDFVKLCESKGAVCCDVLADEFLAHENAMLTAEGAISIAVFNSDKSLYKSKVLILGFGRIAKSLIKMLEGYGAEITVAARKIKNLAECSIWGCVPIHINNIERHDFDFIFNTVPSLVLDSDTISRMDDPLIIDLSTGGAGVDFNAAEKSSKRAIYAPSLPGKYSPESAARIIKDVIENF